MDIAALNLMVTIFIGKKDQRLEQEAVPQCLKVDFGDRNAEDVLRVEAAGIGQALHRPRDTRQQRIEKQCECRRGLHQVRKLALEAGVSIKTHITLTNGPAETTLVMSDLLKTDLIISMTDDGSGPLGFFGEKFDETLVNQAKVPVLSIPPEPGDESLGSISIAGY